MDRCDELDACMLDRRCPSYEVCLVVMKDADPAAVAGNADLAEEDYNRRLLAGGDL